MKNLNKTVFIRLFKEACLKCFGFPLTSTLSEADSKLLSNTIFEHTGLVIGAKSIKNYSLYVLNTKDSKRENPSVATLDTLARYVLDAPYTDEIQRKNNESHYPYWFQYRSRFVNTVSNRRMLPVNRERIVVISFIIIAITIGLFVIRSLTKKNRRRNLYRPFQFSSRGFLKK